MFEADEPTRIDFAGPSVVLATVVPTGLILPDSNFLLAPVAMLATPDAPAVLVCIPTPDVPAVLCIFAETADLGTSVVGIGGRVLADVPDKSPPDFGEEGGGKRASAVAPPTEKGFEATPARVLPLGAPTSEASFVPLGALVVLSMSFGTTSVEERTVATVDCTDPPTDAVVTGAVEVVTFATPTDVAIADVSDWLAASRARAAASRAMFFESIALLLTISASHPRL